MNIALEFFQYLLKAKGRHGTHSPYVYDFVDVCLRLPIPSDIKNGFKNYFHGLHTNRSSIEVMDYGAGSKKMGKRRRVSKIARVSGSNGKYGELLFRITQHYKPAKVLELGTSLGLGSWMLSRGNTNAAVTAVEGCPNTYNFVKNELSSLSNIKCVNASFVHFLESNHTHYDVVYIDGDHRGSSVIEMLELLEPTLKDETIIIIDDIRWSEDMLCHWKQIVAMERYHLTMDLFRMGIVVKRTHQQKEHFIVKY
jgi:predicted O-methyltransferase YrrM